MMRNKLKYTQYGDPQAIYRGSNDGEQGRGGHVVGLVQRRWLVAEVQYGSGKAESGGI